MHQIFLYWLIMITCFNFFLCCSMTVYVGNFICVSHMLQILNAIELFYINSCIILCLYGCSNCKTNCVLKVSFNILPSLKLYRHLRSLFYIYWNNHVFWWRNFEKIIWSGNVFIDDNINVVCCVIYTYIPWYSFVSYFFLFLF